MSPLDSGAYWIELGLRIIEKPFQTHIARACLKFQGFLSNLVSGFKEYGAELWLFM